MFKIHFAFRDWIYSLTIGFLVVSYWRGTWTLLDVVGCDQPPEASLAGGDSFCFAVPAAENPGGDYAKLRVKTATRSYFAGLILLFIGVTLINSGFWLPNRKTLKVTRRLGVVRFVIVYILGASAVCLWRGIWYWADAWILPDNPLASYWLTSVVGAGTAFLLCCGNSLLAPPAIFLLDGPDSDPPPIAGTALAAYYAVALPVNQERPRNPGYVSFLDIVFSFGLIPFAVVWFWRGSWLVLDNYLWGFTASVRDVRLSIVWSMILFGICIWLTSEPVVGRVDRTLGQNKVLLRLLGRLRTYVLAWGTVSLWRCFWVFWDELLGGTSLLSASLGHVLSLLLLTSMGCVSCICAPASTIGVDTIPHDECEDEPLFSMVPLPWESLYAFGIFRQIDESKVDENKRYDLVRPVSTGDIELMYGREEEKGGVVGEESSPAGGGGGEDEQHEDEDGKIMSPPPPSGTAASSPETAASGSPTSGSQRVARSQRPGVIRSEGASSYLNLLGSNKPGLRLAVCSEYSQRPNEDNPRSRSRLFKSR